MSNTSYKIELWKEMMALLSQIENRSSGSIIVTVIVGVVVSILEILNRIVSDSNDFQQIINIIYIVLPCIILIALLAYSLDVRSAAIIKGYIAGIEDLINYELNEVVFQFCSYYPWMYATKYFPTNNLISRVFGIIVIILSGFCFTNIFKMDFIPLFIKLAYLIIYIFIMIKIAHDVFTNPKIRKTARAYFHKIYSSLKTEKGKSSIDELINLRVDIDKIIRESKVDNE